MGLNKSQKVSYSWPVTQPLCVTTSIRFVHQKLRVQPPPGPVGARILHVSRCSSQRLNTAISLTDRHSQPPSILTHEKLKPHSAWPGLRVTTFPSHRFAVILMAATKAFSHRTLQKNRATGHPDHLSSPGMPASRHNNESVLWHPRFQSPMGPKSTGEKSPGQSQPETQKPKTTLGNARGEPPRPGRPARTKREGGLPVSLQPCPSPGALMGRNGSPRGKGCTFTLATARVRVQGLHLWAHNHLQALMHGHGRRQA